MSSIIGPASFEFFGIFPAAILSFILPLVGVGLFAYIMARRLAPLVRAAPDYRLDHIGRRIRQLIVIWLGQVRQPRYMLAGVLHIVIFFGFLILSIRSVSLVVIGFSDGFVLPGFSGLLGDVYNVLKDYAATFVLIACIIAGVRRGVFKPARYAVPEKYGKDHTGEAVFVLGIIATLMISETLFEASELAYALQQTGEAHFVAPLTLVWIFKILLSGASFEYLQGLHIFSYFLHDVTFFFFLCFLPLGKHFHVITSLFNVFFMRLDKGKIKPVRHGVTAEQLDDLESFGVKKLEDFTWKHMLDTCGACEEECPLAIEYIDKMVDLRRGMVDEGMVPQSLQKPLKALEKRGNPYGKMEKKRADWALEKEFKAAHTIKDLAKDEADTLYFVDSITSYDDNIQEIARYTAVILQRAGVDFGILGKTEKDSGHEVLRFGEEMLYQDLKEQNTRAILDTGVKQIVTADPHAYNALKNDYTGLPPVRHISQVVAQKITSGALDLKPCLDPDKVYVYHDPCYLGRHNGVYEDPRQALDAIEGLTRVEMEKSRDRSFCCGGGGLMLFYEPEEDTRMGVLRVNMAAEAGANVIVTACPFCLVNIQDAIKVAGKEGEMEAMDFTQLIARHLR
ncbi:MAG: (Fe-S)-binding protein [Desulfobacteraceae bacterium]|nr:(Fe-S)-binding protein [Desulfobacteraceae bacterium]